MAGCAVLLGLAPGQGAEWRLIKPTNSGIPGEAVRFARFDPQGDLWVAARWPFFSEGGVAARDHQTNIWTTYANWDSPMPSQFVNDIEFGDGGVVWMATSGGLVKKVGDNWTMYNTANAPFFHNLIASVELAPNGDVWIINSTFGGLGAVFRFDGQSWQRFTVGQELPWAEPWVQLTGLEVSADGHVWVGNETQNGVAEYDGQAWTLHGAAVDRFGQIMEDLNGNIWLIAGIGGFDAFYKFDGIGFTTYTSANTPFVDPTITTETVDAGGAVYVGNWGGQVIKTTDGGASWTSFTSQDSPIFSIAPAPDGHVWVTTPGAARHLDENGIWLEALNVYNTGLPDNFISDILGDSHGNVWFAGHEGGFSLFDEAHWSNQGSHNPNALWPVLADGADNLFEDSGGNIWVGTVNGIARWDGRVLSVWDWTNSNLGAAGFIGITQDGSGTIWAGSKFSGIAWFDGADWQWHQFAPPGETGNWIKGLDADPDGNVWVVSLVALHMFDGAAWRDFPTLGAALSNLGGPITVKAGADGTIWIGTNGGLVAFDGTNWKVYDTTNSPLTANGVQSIAIRSDGMMGVSAADFGPSTPFPNGLAVIDGDIDDLANWTVYTFENSPLRHYQLGAVAFDQEGDLWISTISEGVAELKLPPVAVPGDFDGDGDVDTTDFNQFASCFTGPGGGPIDPGCGPGDLDGDSDIDCGDWDLFVLAWTAPGLPPSLPQCSSAIPTVSGWGLIVMTLFLLTSGALVFSHRRRVARKCRAQLEV